MYNYIKRVVDRGAEYEDGDVLIYRRDGQYIVLVWSDLDGVWTQTSFERWGDLTAWVKQQGLEV